MRRLVGRTDELRALTDHLSAITTRGATVVVVGEPGIGKSALLDAGADIARRAGTTVLACGGAPSESHLPFAVLQQLLQPLLTAPPAGVPDAELALLGRALGTLENVVDAPDPQAVAMATLSLLRAAGASAPVLVCVEDVQWLDPSSARVLSFVARRVANLPIMLLCTSRRAVPRELDGTRIWEIALARLDDDLAAELVRSEAPGLSPALRSRLVREASGIPLALVELAKAWQRLPSGTVVAGLVPITARLEAVFAERVDALPSTCQDLLLLAALYQGGPSLGDGAHGLLAAARALGHADASLDDLTAAVDAGLVETGAARVRFRHPLIRSAVHDRAGEARRRAAHAALAQTLAEPDRAIWHRAASMTGPDETVAASLAQSAERARRRGAVLESVRLLELAAELTPDPTVRGRRLVQTAYHAADLGHDDAVTRLLDQADALPLTRADRARSEWRRYRPRDVVGDHDRMRELVVVLGRLHEAGEVETALESLAPTADIAWWRGIEPRCRDLFCGAAVTLTNGNDPRLLAALALTAPLSMARTVRRGLAEVHGHTAIDPERLTMIGRAATVIGDVAQGTAYLNRATGSLREQGRLGLLTSTLVAQAWNCWHLGRWDEAAAAVREVDLLELARERPMLSTRLLGAVLTAERGDGTAGLRALDAAAEQVMASGSSTLAALAAYARGTVLLTLERADEAFGVLSGSFASWAGDVPESVATMHHGMLAVLVDAADRVGALADVGDVVDTLEDDLQVSGSPLLAASLAFARPRVGGGDVESLHRAAVDELAGWPFLRSRARLAYGRWLRRERRIVEARRVLHTAQDGFDALRAVHWADRTRQELRAAGETGMPVTSNPGAVLTAQELQIAQFAAAGLTNREIASRLFLSHRTVGSHLYHIFPKLGVASRAELGRVLPELDGEQPT